MLKSINLLWTVQLHASIYHIWVPQNKATCHWHFRPQFLKVGNISFAFFVILFHWCLELCFTCEHMTCVFNLISFKAAWSIELFGLAFKKLCDHATWNTVSSSSKWRVFSLQFWSCNLSDGNIPLTVGKCFAGDYWKKASTLRRSLITSE